ncbi:MAG: hypothetical protein EA425_18240 [Puniceicoccaceae bacterium]|nr:MAG: hypothetical protein EA425_18240 [Puniceicoccaceae bacterium]
MKRHTRIDIDGESFLLNGKPTYPGLTYNGIRLEGLLLNSRMVQGVFEDLNPETRDLWAYPDGTWDPGRNTREFIEAMPQWRRAGLLAFTINFQGGSPTGYGQAKPWINNAFEADGALRPDYAERMRRIIDRADELGMAVILGFFYFGQDQHLKDEAAVLRATDEATDWILGHGYQNVLVETGNEIDARAYNHAIIRPPRGAELVTRIRDRSRGRVANTAGHLHVGASFSGNKIPTPEIVAASDIIYPHGNGVGPALTGDPARIREMVRQIRALPAYRGQPIVFNEDDHFAFDQPDNHFLAALGEGASWGYFDYRMKDEGFAEGYQSVPVDWGIGSERKRGFFNLLAKITGSDFRA